MEVPGPIELWLDNHGYQAAQVVALWERIHYGEGNKHGVLGRRYHVIKLADGREIQLPVDDVQS